MRVLFFLETFGLGGVESFVVNSLEHLKSKSVDIDCCVARKTTTLFDERIRASGVSFYDLGNTVDAFPGIRYKRAVRLFADYLADNEYDIVHIHANHGVDYCFAYVAKGAGVPRVIMHSHNTNVTCGGYKSIGHYLFRAVFSRYADDFCACSQEAAEWLFPKYVLQAGEYAIVPNGIDLEEFKYSQDVHDSMRAEFGLKNQKIIGHVGRFNYQKNHEFLIESFALIAEARKDVTLVLVGEGELLDEVRLQVKKLGLEDRVVFAGSRADMPRLYAGFDLMLFPSRFEGLSIALLEAQASSLPIVAADTISSETVVSERLRLVPLEKREWARVALEELDKNVSRNLSALDPRLLQYSSKESAVKLLSFYEKALV